MAHGVVYLEVHRSYNQTIAALITQISGGQPYLGGF